MDLTFKIIIVLRLKIIKFYSEVKLNIIIIIIIIIIIYNIIILSA